MVYTIKGVIVSEEEYLDWMENEQIYCKESSIPKSKGRRNKIKV